MPTDKTTEQQIADLQQENAQLKKSNADLTAKHEALESRIIALERINEDARIRGIGADTLGF